MTTKTPAAKPAPEFILDACTLAWHFAARLANDPRSRFASDKDVSLGTANSGAIQNAKSAGYRGPLWTRELREVRALGLLNAMETLAAANGYDAQTGEPIAQAPALSLTEMFANEGATFGTV